ncbi:CASP-like protein 5A1 [Linum perenne]
MKDIQGLPGTKGGLALRVAQFFFATASLLVMSTTSDFPSVTAFWYGSSSSFTAFYSFLHILIPQYLVVDV